MMTALNRRPSNPTSIVTLETPQPADFADCITNQHTAQRRRGHHHSLHSIVILLFMFYLYFYINFVLDASFCSRWKYLDLKFYKRVADWPKVA